MAKRVGRYSFFFYSVLSFFFSVSSAWGDGVTYFDPELQDSSYFRKFNHILKDAQQDPERLENLVQLPSAFACDSKNNLHNLHFNVVQAQIRYRAENRSYPNVCETSAKLLLEEGLRESNISKIDDVIYICPDSKPAEAAAKYLSAYFFEKGDYLLAGLYADLFSRIIGHGSSEDKALLFRLAVTYAANLEKEKSDYFWSKYASSVSAESHKISKRFDSLFDSKKLLDEVYKKSLEKEIRFKFKVIQEKGRTFIKSNDSFLLLPLIVGGEIQSLYKNAQGAVFGTQFESLLDRLFSQKRKTREPVLRAIRHHSTEKIASLFRVGYAPEEVPCFVGNLSFATLEASIAHEDVLKITPRTIQFIHRLGKWSLPIFSGHLKHHPYSGTGKLVIGELKYYRYDQISVLGDLIINADDQLTRVSAIYQLGKLGPNALPWVPLLIDYMTADLQPHCILSASVNALANIGPKVIPSVYNLFISTEDMGIRRQLLWIISKYKVKESLDILSECLTDGDENIRNYALVLLKEFKDSSHCSFKGMAEKIVPLIKDPNVSVRYSACSLVSVIPALNTPEVRAGLEELANAEVHDGIRNFAGQVLAQLKSRIP